MSEPVSKQQAVDALDWLSSTISGGPWPDRDKANFAVIRSFIAQSPDVGAVTGQFLYEAFWRRNGGNCPAWSEQATAIIDMWNKIAADALIATPPLDTVSVGRDLVSDDRQASPQGERKSRPLTQCAADRDGDCNHPECPQIRDGEPKATGRHCPIDTWKDDD